MASAFSQISHFSSFSRGLVVTVLAAGVACAIPSPALAQSRATLASRFSSPSDGARPWVYWYFMDGNATQEGMHADLEAMKKAGIGGGIFLEVNIGVPRGPVNFMSPQWQDNFAYAVSEAKRLGLQIALGTGPGWTGSGGPWVKPEDSMQHLVASSTSVSGPTSYDAILPRPKPRTPFFGDGSMTAQGRSDWQNFYKDEVVLAFPTPQGNARLDNVDQKALFYRAPYSSSPGTPPRLPSPSSAAPATPDQCVPESKVIVLTSKLDADGRLKWDVPAGNWTIMRFGRTLTGQTTRPAPDAGLGFESDKFEIDATDRHLDSYVGTLLKKLGPNYKLTSAQGEAGLTMLHFDSWEMSSQNWSPTFQQEFIKRRGYDPTPFLPAMQGVIVENPQRSERFLWDLRATASELVVEHHALELKKYAHDHNLKFSVEPYDMNPSADLDLGSTADLPMGEFWSKGYGFNSEFSCWEAVSVGHTNGRPIIGAESFTSDGGDGWLQYPGNMKNQLDWALCTGINKFVIHRYQHQPALDKYPGMTMGPYGVHWERTETWWDMVPAFHKYMARTSEILRQGLPVADILYLTPEGAPQVFTPPTSALTSGNLPDHKGYSFDGCSPKTLIARATVKNGNIVFPDGTTYRILVLPASTTMTPELERKIASLVEAGATIVGSPPSQSPSLSGYPVCDTQVKTIAARLWGQTPKPTVRKVGKGRVLFSAGESEPRLQSAKWIWFNEGNPAQSAPVGTRYFQTNLQLAAGHIVQTAIATMTADNSFKLSVNGHQVGDGDNFHTQFSMDIAPWLKAGSNQIRVEAGNEGDSPNPAGLIGAIAVTFTDGTQQSLATDANWNAMAPGGTWSPAKELGAGNMGPWGLDVSTTPLYPEYSTVAAQLKTMGVAPDFTAGAPMRFIHRHTSEGEVYFVANSSDQNINTIATFRISGYIPEHWNPVNGEMHTITDYAVSGGTTRVKLQLAPYESAFIVFRKRAQTKAPTQISAGSTIYVPRLTVSTPWNVSFDPKWGAPANITFNTLDDWAQRPEPSIKYYSGKAVYTTNFDLQLNAGNTVLSLGKVNDMASVKLNGKDLGIVWCAPWQVSIPAGTLKPTGNRLEITVANRWVNKLIEESGKPENERQTWTTYNPWHPNSPLQPSGLLGPVTVGGIVKSALR